MTLEKYNEITGLREQGKTWKEVKEHLGAKVSYLTLKNRYNKMKKATLTNDITHHTPLETEEIQLLKEAEPKEVIHHSLFSTGDLDTLKEMIAEYRERKESQKGDMVEIYDWVLPAEYKKIKNTQVSIRLNKTLFEDLKREVSKVDSDIKVAEIVNKALCDLLCTLKDDL